MSGEWGGTSGEGALVLRLGGWGRSNNCFPATDPTFPTGGLADALAGVLGMGGCLVLFDANV